jgi:hypothetical protein
VTVLHGERIPNCYGVQARYATNLPPVGEMGHFRTLFLKIYAESDRAARVQAQDLQNALIEPNGIMRYMTVSPMYWVGICPIPTFGEHVYETTNEAGKALKEQLS